LRAFRKAVSGLTRTQHACNSAIADAGYLSSAALAEFVDKVKLHGWRWPKRKLVIIDYASASAIHLKKWFETLAATDPEPAFPLRILLLDRQASEAFKSERTASLFENVEPIALDPIDESEQRRYILKAERFADPLILQMAALNPNPIEALARTRTDLAFDLARRERDRIKHFATPRTETAEDFLIHMAAFVTMAGGLDDPRQTIQREATALGVTEYEPAQCAKDIDPALANSPIQPDIVGEAFILETFPRPPEGRREPCPPPQSPSPSLRIAQNFALEEMLTASESRLARSVLDWLEVRINAGAVDDPVLRNP
jgi:hypothetical protein